MTLLDQRHKKSCFQQRLFFCVVITGLAAILLLLRCAYLQILQSSHYSTLAKQNRLNLVPIAPSRGLIYDRNSILIAENIPIFSLMITPEQTDNLNQTLDELAQVITITTEDRTRFMHLLSQHRRFHAIPIRYKLSETEVAAFSIQRYRFKGVSVQANLMRHYPLGAPSVAILGYMGQLNSNELSHIDSSNYAATNTIGKAGIEQYYENILHGKIGYQEVEVNASGHTIRTLKHIAPVAGANLYLTIDSHLQQLILSAFQHKRGAAIALDPNNGEILAFVSSPSFDPNPLVQGIANHAYAKLRNDPNQPLYNRALKGNYPIGSPIKPFIALGGLRNQIITPDTYIHDLGFFQVPHTSHHFRDWTPAGHGWVNLNKAIVVSCDTYFYQLAYQLGIYQIDSIMQDFGFGQRVGIDLPREPRGLLPTPQWKRKHHNKPWYTGDTIVAGIGQGYWLATPLQMANATAMLALRGHHFRPHLLHHFQIATHPIDLIKPQTLTPLSLPAKHWNPVIKAMQQVITSPIGTGRHHFGPIPSYSIAAKTGTVQHFEVKANERYNAANTPERLKDDSTFIAFAPVKHPKIVIFIVVENNSQAAPGIARQALDYYLTNQAKAGNDKNA